MLFVTFLQVPLADPRQAFSRFRFLAVLLLANNLSSGVRLPHAGAVDQRPAIVRTGGSNGEYLCSATHQKHGLAVSMADQFVPIGKLGERNAEGQIGSARV